MRKLLLVWLMLPQVLFATHFSNIIVFGNGTVDIGNNTWIPVSGRSIDFEQGAPVTNLDPRTQTPKSWLSYLVQSGILDSQILLPSVQLTNEDITTNNISYGWSGAETGNVYVNDRVFPNVYGRECQFPGELDPDNSCVPGVLKQVRHYVSQLVINNKVPNSETLFIISPGEADIFNRIQRIAYRVSHVKQSYQLAFFSKRYSLAWFSSWHIYQAVQVLIKAGVPADHIYVLTAMDLATTPAVVNMAKHAYPDNPVLQGYCLTAVRFMTKLYNWSLRTYLTLGVRGLAKPHVIDTQTLLDSIAANGNFQAEFTHRTESCLAQHADPHCLGYVYFDNRHFTVKMNEFFAERFAKTL